MVSVLMCTYNRRFCLKQAIDSVLCQTYPDFEFVIVDDGSTDGTEELIKSYQDPRIRYFKLNRNSFYCYAANQGRDHCQGDYVAFMNSDDAWLPDKLEKQVTVMEEDRMLGACFTRVYLVDESGNDLSEECRDMAELFDRKCSTQKEYLHTLLQSGNFLCHPSALVRKSVLDKIGYFNLLYRQLADYDLWLRIVSEAEITVLEERLIRFQWDIKGKKQISMSTRENSVRAFNESVMIRKNCVESMTDEKFCQFFREDFRNPDSVSHLQLEFEKAFWLMKCIEEVPGLKAAGMEMLGQIMREANAMETLREHFHLDIFDLYQWNGEHMYKTPWLISEIEEGSQQLAYYKDILKQKDEYIGQQKEQLEKQNAAIEQQQEYIEGQRRQAAHYEEQLDELGRRMEQKTGQLKKYEDKIREQDEMIQTYANSTSWKITEPMRKIMRLLKK